MRGIELLNVRRSFNGRLRILFLWASARIYDNRSSLEVKRRKNAHILIIMIICLNFNIISKLQCSIFNYICAHRHTYLLSRPLKLYFFFFPLSKTLYLFLMFLLSFQFFTSAERASKTVIVLDAFCILSMEIYNMRFLACRPLQLWL